MMSFCKYFFFFWISFTKKTHYLRCLYEYNTARISESIQAHYFADYLNDCLGELKISFSFELDAEIAA